MTKRHETTQEIIDRLDGIRLARGMTKKELSIAAGMDFSFWSRILTLQTEPNFGALARAGEALGYAVDLVPTTPRPVSIGAASQAVVQRLATDT